MAEGDQASSDELLRLSTGPGRWVLTAAVLGSAVVSLDATVVNVALPTIGRELHASVSGETWTVNGYSLTLAALILLGGSLGDRFGRRRLFVIGTIWFGTASLLCGIAPNLSMLITARALQGIGGALLTPGSLALLQASFQPADRARAIGAWSGLGGIAGAIGPLIGGAMLGVSWRLVFLINLPLCAFVVFLALKHVPESRNENAPKELDFAGSAAGAIGLGGVTYALIQVSEGSRGPVTASAIVGVAALAAFIEIERRSSHPLIPLDIFRSRQFTAANLVTFALYAALGANFFLLAIVLQVSVGLPPVVAGASLLPLTLIMLTLSARAGQLATRIGPRRPMTFGPILVTAGLLLLLRVGPGSNYLVDVLPAVIVFGLGLALTVAPLTATVLAAAENRHAGVASGVNNAVARTAALLAVAALPVVMGLSGAGYQQPHRLAHGFHIALLWCAGLVLVSAVIAWFGIRDDVLEAAGPTSASAPPAEPGPKPYHCAVCGPPASTSERAQPQA